MLYLQTEFNYLVFFSLKKNKIIKYVQDTFVYYIIEHFIKVEHLSFVKKAAYRYAYLQPQCYILR